MKKRGLWTKVLAVSGMTLSWIPIFMTLVTGAAGSIWMKRWIVDYLMPAELFWVALAGGALLIWAAARARLFLKGMIAGPAAMALFLGACQLTAELTGLAHGTAPAESPALAVVMAFLALYTLALLFLCGAATLLVRRLLRKGPERIPAEK